MRTSLRRSWWDSVYCEAEAGRRVSMARWQWRRSGRNAGRWLFWWRERNRCRVAIQRNEPPAKDGSLLGFLWIGSLCHLSPLSPSVGKQADGSSYQHGDAAGLRNLYICHAEPHAVVHGLRLVALQAGRGQIGGDTDPTAAARYTPRTWQNGVSCFGPVCNVTTHVVGPIGAGRTVERSHRRQIVGPISVAIVVIIGVVRTGR